MCARLGWDMHIHQLRHYSATELIAAGVDVRTVAGRLGHGGGGTTTLKVYSACVAEADQRAAGALVRHLPPLPAHLTVVDGRGGGVTSRWRRSSRGRSLTRADRMARSGQAGRAGPSWRRSTVTSCRSVSVSAMSVLLRRQSRASQDSIRVMVR